jgi:hypothetical protein
VRFEVTVDATHGTQCNCTICTKLGAIGTHVKPAAFRVLQGEESCLRYAWAGKVSTRFTCATCGVYCYGRGHLEMLGGDFISLNLNTLDDFDPALVHVQHWDGRHNNWMGGLRDTPWPVHV